MIRDIADTDGVAGPELDPAFAALIDHDLGFDTLVKSQHFPALPVRLRRNPQLRSVIDQAGKPGIAQAGYETRMPGIEALAAEPDVNCKWAGLLLNLASDDSTWLDTARRLLARCASGHEPAVSGGTATRAYRLDCQASALHAGERDG